MFQIIRWRENLYIPTHEISKEAADLIRGLLCDTESRLGSNGGADEIKDHPFFNGIDWSALNQRQMQAPWKPDFASASDTQYFDFDEGIDPPPIPSDDELNYDDDNDSNGNQFYGFTFRRFLTNGGPPPDFFQGDNSKSTNKNSGNSRGSAAAAHQSQQASNNAPDAVYV